MAASLEKLTAKVKPAPRKKAAPKKRVVRRKAAPKAEAPPPVEEAAADFADAGVLEASES